MAHKKIERKKELDRRRKRRAERMKLRAREARSGLKAWGPVFSRRWARRRF